MNGRTAWSLVDVNYIIGLWVWRGRVFEVPIRKNICEETELESFHGEPLDQLGADGLKS
ncbi:MAG: hypothetical protein ACI8TX_003939 [Hyphomicrobiaceae bacterium]|jgi:hypothetical protein